MPLEHCKNKKYGEIFVNIILVKPLAMAFLSPLVKNASCDNSIHREITVYSVHVLWITNRHPRPVARLALDHSCLSVKLYGVSKVRQMSCDSNADNCYDLAPSSPNLWPLNIRSKAAYSLSRWNFWLVIGTWQLSTASRHVSYMVLRIRILYSDVFMDS